MNGAIGKVSLVLCAVMGVIAALLLAPASPALADPPVRQLIPIDETFTIPASEFTCNIDITQHVEGTLRMTTGFDRNGNPVREIDTAPNLRITFTNPANGRSVSTHAPASFHATIGDDGSFLFAIVGLQGHIVVPGRGVVTMDAGRLEMRQACPDCQQEIRLLGRFDSACSPPSAKCCSRVEG